MKVDSEKQDPNTSGIPIIEISSDSYEDTSPTKGKGKEESPEHQAISKSSILTTPGSSKKKNSYGSGRRKVKRIPCHVCPGRFLTQANLEMHMKMHWNVFDKMDVLYKSVKNKIKNRDLINQKCNCTRCIYESEGDKNRYQIEKNFECHVCSLSFYSANKLSKHMDKHRETYSKMKKLEEEHHILFIGRRFPLENRTVDLKSIDTLPTFKIEI